MSGLSAAAGADERRAGAVADERAIVARVRSGEDAAFEEVFRTHYEGLFLFAYSYLRSREAARDVVHDVFLALWTRRVSWDVRGSVRGYLYGATRNRALNALKHERVVRRWEGRAAEELSRADAGGAEADETDEAQANARAAALAHAVSRLPESHRRVLALRTEHGLTYSEIAGILGLSVRTVETQIARAMQALRDAFQPGAAGADVQR